MIGCWRFGGLGIGRGCDTMESKKKTGGSSGQEEFGALREMEALRGHGVIIVLLCYSGRPNRLVLLYIIGQRSLYFCFP